MSKHMRLVVSVLFIVVILLAIAITRFYSKTSQKTSGRSAQTDIGRRLAADSDGNRIFEDSSGLFGVIDSGDRVIVPAEWRELSFAGDGRCIASKRIGGSLLKGCVDYEGNVIVPFIYKSITAYEGGGQTVYAAVSDSDSSVVLYDGEFSPVFRKVWTSCEINGDKLILTSDSGRYEYSAGSQGFTLLNAKVSGEALGCEYSFEVKSAETLSLLDPAMLDYMSTALGHYLEFAYTGDGSYISDIRTAGLPVFKKLFPDEKQILSRKLAGIRSIFFYKANSAEDVPHFAFSVLAETELTYSAEDSDQPAKLIDQYRAVVEFSGSSESDLAAVSGGFVSEAPNYPAPETPPIEVETGMPPDVNETGDVSYE